MSEIKRELINSYYYRDTVEIVNKDGEFVRQAEFYDVFKTTEKVDAFDSEGNLLGKFTKKESEETIKEVRIIQDRDRRLVQYGFDFFMMPLEVTHNQEEVLYSTSLLKKVWPDILCSRIDDEKYDFYSVSSKKTSETQKNKLIKDLNLCLHHSLQSSDFKYQEICLIGNTYSITPTKKLQSPDEYKKNMEAAIEKWPDWTREIESLYHTNLGLITLKNKIKPVYNVDVNILEDGTVYFDYKIDGVTHRKKESLIKTPAYECHSNFQEHLEKINLSMTKEVYENTREILMNHNKEKKPVEDLKTL